MTIEQYWKFLHMLKSPEHEVKFYDNGCFSVQDANTLFVYDAKGKIIYSGALPVFVTSFSNGIFEIDTLGHIAFYDQQGQKLFAFDYSAFSAIKNFSVLDYGYVLQYNYRGLHFIRDVRDPDKEFLLGDNLEDIVSGPDGYIFYKKRPRESSPWTLIQLNNGKKCFKNWFDDVDNVSFFANGGYVLYCKNNVARVFNNRGNLQFTCCLENTIFKPFKNNLFWAYNGINRKGLYSMSRLLIKTNETAISGANENAFCTPSKLVIFTPNKECISDVYNVIFFSQSLVFFQHKQHSFVIDTKMPLDTLKQTIIHELATAWQIEYKNYLLELLSLLY